MFQTNYSSPALPCNHQPYEPINQSCPLLADTMSYVIVDVFNSVHDHRPLYNTYAVLHGDHNRRPTLFVNVVHKAFVGICATTIFNLSALCCGSSSLLVGWPTTSLVRPTHHHLSYSFPLLVMMSTLHWQQPVSST